VLSSEECRGEVVKGIRIRSDLTPLPSWKREKRVPSSIFDTLFRSIRKKEYYLGELWRGQVKDRDEAQKTRHWTVSYIEPDGNGWLKLRKESVWKSELEKKMDGPLSQVIGGASGVIKAKRCCGGR